MGEGRVHLWMGHQFITGHYEVLWVRYLAQGSIGRAQGCLAPSSMSRTPFLVLSAPGLEQGTSVFSSVPTKLSSHHW